MDVNNFSKAYESLKEDLMQINQSPTFAMSLGAKELFHTNFLAYILETNNKEFEKSQTSLIKLFTDESSGSVSVFREKNHLDLIVSHEKIDVYIEAKLKSLPSNCQLDLYNKTIGNFNKNNTIKKKIKKIIISPVDPFFNNDLGWIWFGWDKIHDAIEDAGPAILMSYKSDLSLINKICKTVYDELDPSRHKWTFIHDLATKFQNIRIHDVIGKLMTDKIRVIFEKNFKNQHPGIFEKIEILTEYTHQQPIITIKTINKISGSDYKIGVQIQGKDERFFIESDKYKSAEDLYLSSNNNKVVADLWIFNGNLFGRGNCRLAINSADWTCLYKFGSNFRYGRTSELDKINLNELISKTIDNFIKIFEGIENKLNF